MQVIAGLVLRTSNARWPQMTEWLAEGNVWTSLLCCWLTGQVIQCLVF